MLAHVLGPITITGEIGGMMTLEPMKGYDRNDRRGEENIRAERGVAGRATGFVDGLTHG